ncbi:MAG: hypothetical protein QOJ63_3632 [Solirubrobacteraceae bacterium]|jgi:hypothetical protein|nr:hypothetical protein [Solirubrobacteraceae bacterium]
MRTKSIQAGDIVFCNKGGRLFHAKVIGAGPGGTLMVEPIERNISHRRLKASEIADHWAHNVATRREDRAPQAQTTLGLSLPA